MDRDRVLPAQRLRFVQDDLSGEAVRALVERHLHGMRASSPPESVHAFDIEKLRAPGVVFWSAWVDEPAAIAAADRNRGDAASVGSDLAAMGALKRLDATRGEIKSMRVADAYLGCGIGRAMLEHIVAQARAIGLTSLWLETGTTPDFAPARQLYRSAGFVDCGPFEDYGPDPFSAFMTRALR